MSKKLRAHIADIINVQKTIASINWQLETNALPTNSVDSWLETLNTLTTYEQRLTLDPKFGDLLRKIKPRNKVERLMVDNWREIRADAKKVPEKLNCALQEVSNTTTLQWKSSETFEQVLPSLENLVSLTKEWANCFEGDQYNSLIECFEPGFDSDYITSVFDTLKPKLIDLHSRGKRAKFENCSLNIANTAEVKRKLWNVAANALRYDLSKGQVAVTVHPFMQAFDKNDVRVAVNDNVDSVRSFYGAMHEMGHAIYEQNIADELNNTGVGSPFSSALHESQSLFCEQYLGKSELFWNENYENVFEMPGNRESVQSVLTRLRSFDPNNVIRLQASELDYGLHIILRFELEKALFSGQLEPREMREFFNELTLQYFGRYPENDKEGVLQDTHWYSGLFGYFPSYLFGAIFAAQLWDSLKAKQNTQEMLVWLKDNIHVHGGTRDYKTTLKDVTGDEMPNVSLYTDWLEKEFSLAEV